MYLSFILYITMKWFIPLSVIIWAIHGNVISLLCLICINVGFINLLPIPAFDGGHILFIIIEMIKGSPVKPEIENKIHTIFLMLLLGLMLFVTLNDIIRLF